MRDFSLDSVLRYLRLYSHFLRFAASRALQFRAELLFRVLMDVFFYTVFLGFYKILYQHTAHIGQWDEAQALIFVSGFLVVDGLQMTFFADMYHQFQVLYRQGGLDHYLTKPISAWFFVGFRNINFASLINVFIALGIFSYFLAKAPFTFSAIALFVYLALLCLSAFLYYLVMFAMLMSIFWTESAEGPLSIYFECVNFASRPHHIFKGALRTLLLTLVPFSVFASLPAQAFFEDVGWGLVAHVLLVVAGFFLLNLWLWNKGLKRYASAFG